MAVLHHLSSALIATLALLIVAPALLGWGSLVARVCIADRAEKLAAADHLVLGLLAVGALGTVIHFVLPLSAAVSVLTVGVGWIALAQQRRSQRSTDTPEQRRSRAIGLVLILVCGFVAPLGQLNYDTGLYHLPTMLWMRAHPVPLGIVHLTGMFAYNQLWFTIATMLWLPGIGLASAFIVNALCVLALFWKLMDEVLKSGHTEPAGGNTRQWFALALLYVLCTFFWNGLAMEMTSPSTDLPAMTFTLFALLAAVRGLESGAGPRDAIFVVCLAAATLAMTVKSSQLFTLAFPALLLLRSSTGFRFPGWRALRALRAPALVCVTGFFLLWGARSVLLSGCALYPAPQTCVESLPWATTRSEVQVYQNVIRGFMMDKTADAQQVVHQTAWRAPWLKEFLARVRIQRFIAVAVAGLALLLLAAVVPRASGTAEWRELSGYGWLFGIMGAGLVFWFLMSPWFKYALGYLIGVPSLLLALGLALLVPWRRVNRFIPFFAWAMVAQFAVRNLLAPDANPTVKARWPALSTAVFSTTVTRGGVTVAYPVSASGEEDRCWSTPQPCTPQVDSTLTMRMVGPWVVFGVDRAPSTTPDKE